MKAAHASGKPKRYDAVVTFVKANGLKAGDVGGKSDPFLLATCNDEKYRTAVCPKTVDPIWKEKWGLQNVLSGSKVIMEIYDQDVFSKDFLGSCEYIFTDHEECGKDRDIVLDVIDFACKGVKQGTLTFSLFVKRISFDIEVKFVKGTGLKETFHE